MLRDLHLNRYTGHLSHHKETFSLAKGRGGIACMPRFYTCVYDGYGVQASLLKEKLLSGVKEENKRRKGRTKIHLLPLSSWKLWIGELLLFKINFLLQVLWIFFPSLTCSKEKPQANFGFQLSQRRIFVLRCFWPRSLISSNCPRGKFGRQECRGQIARGKKSGWIQDPPLVGKGAQLNDHSWMFWLYSFRVQS